MGFNCGIVGLPNVGKSTLFNALTSTAAAHAANFPFCTIEPNVGRVAVPDDRLIRISEITQSAETVPTQLEFVDIAGLVKGASRGEGLGNKFLANIREVDAVIHVLRCFEDSNVTHIDDTVDPIRDAEIVETELMLADMESLEKRIDPISKRARSGEKDAKDQMALMEPVLKALKAGKPARTARPDNETGERQFNQLQLLTAKPVLYACNVDESSAGSGNGYSQQVADKADEDGARFVTISAAIEAEVAQLENADEQQDFLETLGLGETGLSRVIRAGYGLLDLITYFTTEPKESRAWTVRSGASAPQAAGIIHTDFEKGFIRAETVAFDDFVALGGEQAAKDAGKMRQEGKDYIVKDGDVLHFLFNV